jgi:flagellar protein FliS
VNALTAARSLYNRDAVLSASPARILTMLYDRLLLDLQRAETAQLAGNWTAASPNLLHAQEIVAELSSSLKPELWEGGPGLFAIYTFVTTTLISANVDRSVERTRECIALLEPLRQSWHQAAATVATTSSAFDQRGQALA